MDVLDTPLVTNVLELVTNILEIVREPAAFLVLFAILFVIGKWFYALATSYAVDQELMQKDNPALAISTAGYYLGIIIIFIGAAVGPSTDLIHDLLLVAAYGLGGILLLLLSRVINDWLILRDFSAKRELIDDKNEGTGAVLFGSYVASALIIAGSIQGEGGGPHTAIVFYLLGQVALIAFTWLYDWMAPYSLLEQIEQDNVAAGVGFGGALVAIGLIILRAVSGDFVGWVEDLTYLGWNVLLVFVYLVGVRLFFDKVVLPRSDLNVEITRDRNVGAGLLEGAVSIGFAAVLFFVL